jgi:cold shock protein
VSIGTVKFFNTGKGFGFITQEDGKDLFFHVSEIQGREPQEGDKVEYEVGEGRKGPCALKVKVKN